MNALVPRATVEQLVQWRDSALALYADSYEALVKADAALKLAADMRRNLLPPRGSFSNEFDKDKENFFVAPIKMPAREDYMSRIRHLVDVDLWRKIVTHTDLERLMDKKAKDELRDQLVKDPPEGTVENVYATLQGFMGQAPVIFQRGLAEAFSRLDRRFRSHDGWKIGSRVILDYAFSESGFWNHHRNHDDTLMDIDRVFRVLDGKEPIGREMGIGRKVENEIRRVGHFNMCQVTVEDEYFRIRTFKNGNCHIWFLRDDLLKRVNLLLGDYYGSPIPEERAPETDPFATPKTAVAKNFAFFPTPDETVNWVMNRAERAFYKSGPGAKWLEPSAGNGQLAGALRNRHDVIVDCVEIQPWLAEQLRSTGLYRNVFLHDFIGLQPPVPDQLYDGVLMNPPFDRERDIDHVVHALKFLKPGGVLVAIMSASTEFRETKKSVKFRELMAKMNADWTDMPAGSFASVGTNVNTVLLQVRR